MQMLKIVLMVILIILVVLVIAYLYMLKPNKRRDTSYFEHKYYAHRGLHDENVPENSLTAFRLARENGYGVELDVQMTKDGQLVVFHDGNLNRMCGVDANLRDFTYEELQKLRLKGTDEYIPLFSEVLKTLDGADLICEIKPDNGMKFYELCERTLEMLNSYKGRFIVESFSPFLMGWFKKNHPEIIRGQLSENFVKSNKLNIQNFCMAGLCVNVISRPDFVAYNHLHAGTLGFKLCKAIYKPFTVAWTAKGKAEQESAEKIFDAVIFEKNART